MIAMLNQGFDYGAAGNLDGDGDASGIRGQFSQPLCVEVKTLSYKTVKVLVSFPPRTLTVL
jgi:hypothetical protein